MTKIRLNDVSRRYSQGRLALRGVSLEVQAGELFVLLGPSGSGKTTLLRLIAGLDEPSQGQIWFGDRRVDRWSSARRRVAMVFQEPALFPQWTVRQHLQKPDRKFGEAMLGLRRWLGRSRSGGLEPTSGVGREVVPGKTRAALENLGLEPLLNRKPHQLSGGERQRVALGRAIVRDPAAFLFDEPFSSLDVATRWELRGDLHRVQRELGRTTVYVTHDQAEAFALADRLGVLVDGRLCQVGPPESVYGAPGHVDVARVTGDPPMNLWPGEAVRRGGGWRIESRWWRGDVAFLPEGVVADGAATEASHAAAREGSVRQVWLGVRPERLRWIPGGQASVCQDGWSPGRVEAVEFLGSRWVGVARWDAAGSPADRKKQQAMDGPLIRVSSVEPMPVRVGESVQLSCGTEDIHLFDRVSGERLMKAGRS